MKIQKNNKINNLENKLISFLKKATKENKKILLIGNKPLDNDYGEIIDNYDIVIRFNLSYYNIKSNKISNKKYGSKTDILIINLNVLNGLFFKFTSEIKNLFDLNIFKNLRKMLSLNSDNVKIVRIYNNYLNFKDISINFYDNIFKTNNLSKYVQVPSLFFNDYCKNIKIKLNKHEKFPWESIKIIPTLGLISILLFLENEIKFDILGFNTESSFYFRNYYNLYSNKWKNKNPINVDKIKSHDTVFEKNLLANLVKYNFIKNIEDSSNNLTNKIINNVKKQMKIDEQNKNLYLNNLFLKKNLNDEEFKKDLNELDCNDEIDNEFDKAITKLKNKRKMFILNKKI